jgi:hypothetical protein
MLRKETAVSRSVQETITAILFIRVAVPVLVMGQ